MKVTVLTLFPDMVNAVFSESMIRHAKEIGAIEIEIVNFRDHSPNKHRKVDDYPFGGGPGMLLTVEPIYRALQSIPGHETALKILLTPAGVKYDQAMVKDFAKKDHLILICGHYEGFDERILKFVDMELSIGDYVLTGGEYGAMIIVDSVIRLLPNVLGAEEGYEKESFYDDSLEYPQYTRPQEFMGLKVPDVLLSGNHAEIAKWRAEESRKRTLERRPDLLKKADEKD